MTVAEKLALQQQKYPPPWKQSQQQKERPQGNKRNRSEVITVPPEEVPKPRVPISNLNDIQRHRLRIMTATVKADDDKGLYAEIQGTELPETISLSVSDYLFEVGDCLDVLPAFASKEFKKYIVIGRREPAESE